MTNHGVESGLLVVDKPSGMTSHDVVARVRRLAGTRKVGHAGTLDPMATGVLLIGLGKATRLLGHLMLGEKAYDATVRLGMSTTTDEAEGKATGTTSTAELDEETIREATARFVGDIDQVPSTVSAVKVGGRRAYQRVRAGEQVTLEPRSVTIHELVVRDVVVSTTTTDVRLTLRCSSGTYVRAIARDLGAGLGVGGHLIRLRRTRVGPFDVTTAHTLDALEEHLAVMSLDELARRSFATHELDEAQALDVEFGRSLDVELPTAEPVAVFDRAGRFLALYQQRGGKAAALTVFTG